jgi:hypothetical protein
MLEGASEAADRAATWIECVFLTSSHADVAAVARLVSASGIRIHHARTLEQADFMLLVSGAKVLLADAGAAWSEAQDMLARVHPGTELVLAVADWSESWADAAYEVVQKPFGAEELKRTLTNAHAVARARSARRRRAVT